jgi:hypothetical protein
MWREANQARDGGGGRVPGCDVVQVWNPTAVLNS